MIAVRRRACVALLLVVAAITTILRLDREIESPGRANRQDATSGGIGLTDVATVDRAAFSTSVGAAPPTIAVARLDEASASPDEPARREELREWRVVIDRETDFATGPLDLAILMGAPPSEQVREVRVLADPPDFVTLLAAPGDRLRISGGDVVTAETIVPERSGAVIVIEIRERQRLAGTLLRTEDGGPIDEAEVGVAPMSDPHLVSRHRIGRDFTLRPPVSAPWRITVDSPERAPVELLGVVPSGPIRVELAPITRLFGRVYDESGRPLAGAVVTVGRVGSLPVDERCVGESDSDGAFVLDPIPRDDIVLCARRDGHAPDRLELRRDELPTSRIALHLEVESRLAGRVVDESGRPVEAAHVTVGDLSRHFMTGRMQTGEDGTFEMPWTSARDEYHIAIRAEGFSDADFGPFRPPCEELVLQLRRLRDIEAVVVDDTGAPVVGASVIAIALFGRDEHDHHSFLAPARRACTGSEGTATLPALTRVPHQFVAMDARGEMATIRLGEDDAGPIRIVLPRSDRFSVRWSDASERPISGVRMHPVSRRPDGTCSRLSLRDAVVTDARGHAHLLSSAEVREWWCERPDGALAIRSVTGRCDRVEWQWPSTGDLRVRVADAAGTRATALHVLVIQSDGAARTAAVGPDGRAAISGLATGALRVRLFDEWEASRWQSHMADEMRVALAPDQVLDLDWSLTSDRITGRILGSPPRGARLRVSAVRRTMDATGSGDAATSSIELDGRFVLARRAASAHDIIAVAEAPSELWIDAMTAPVAVEHRGIELEWRAPDARVRVDARATLELLDRTNSLLASARPDQEGLVGIRRVRHAGLRVRLRAAHGVGPARALDELATRDQLDLDEASRIEVTVRRGGASAGAGIEVELGRPAGSEPTRFTRLAARTDRSGEASFTVPDGRYTVIVGPIARPAFLEPGTVSRVVVDLE